MASLTTLVLAIDARQAAVGGNQFVAVTNKIKIAAARAAAANKTAAAANKTLGGSFGTLAKQMGKAFLVFKALQGIKTTINTISQFEESMKTVELVSRATTEQMERMTDVARILGATTRYSANEAAVGLVQLARAGFSAEESMNAIKDSLDMATAGALGLNEATGVMASAIRQFSLDASEAGRVAHALTVVTNNSNQTMWELGDSLKYAGTVAASTGISLEEVGAALGVAADRGIRGTRAGTQFRGVMLALARPTKRMEEALKKMNLRYAQVNPAMNSMTQIMRSLGAGVSSLSNEYDKSNLFAAIFTRRQTALGLAMAEGSDEIEKMISLTDDLHGEHTRMARELEQTIIGKWIAFKSALSEIAHDMGDGGVKGALHGLLDTLVGTTRMLGEVEGGFSKSGSAAKILTAAIVAATAAVATLVVIKVAVALWGMAAATSAAAAGFTALEFSAGLFIFRVLPLLMNPVVAITVAVAALATGLFMSGRAADDQRASILALGDAAGKAAVAVERLQDLMYGPQTVKSVSLQIDELKKLALVVKEAYASGADIGKIDIGVSANIEVDRQEIALWSKLMEQAFQDASHGWSLKLPFTTSGRGAAEQIRLGVGVEGLTEAERLEATLNGIAASIKKLREVREFDVAAMFKDIELDPAMEQTVYDFAQALEVENASLSKLGDTAAETALVQEAYVAYLKDELEMLGTLEGPTADSLELMLKGLRAREANNAAIQEQIDLEKQQASNRDYLQKLEDEVYLLKVLAEQGKLARAEAEATLDMVARGIPLWSAEADRIYALVKAKHDLTEATKGTTGATVESTRAIESWIRSGNEQLAVMEKQKGLSGVFGPEYENAMKKAAISAEASARIASMNKDKMAPEKYTEMVAKIKEMELALLGEVDAMTLLAEKREYAENAAQAFTNAFGSIISGANSAKDAVKGLIEALIQMALQKSLLGPMQDALSGMFMGLGGAAAGGGGGGGGGWDTGTQGGLGGGGGGWVARGGVMEGGNLTRYAYGGVVDSPMYFPTRSGTGLMAEAGSPEAIMPLKRGKDGKLGVASDGGGGGPRVVNVSMNVQTKDADSFRRSRVQIQSDLKRMTTNMGLS